MTRIFLISLASLLLFGGCINTKSGVGEPIVAPTGITNEVQDAEDPVLPPYKPWWVEE